MLLLASLLTLTLLSSSSQDSLDAARQLYESAAFDEALSMLARLAEGGNLDGDQRRQAGEYRMFALFALGRTAEAEGAAEALVISDPAAPLQATDVSPRIRSMFDAVRARLLPRLIREQYRAGRAALDAKDPPAAEAAFTMARALIEEAERAHIADSGLADLRMLVDGFLALATTGPPDAAPPSKATRSVPPEPATPATAPARVSEKAIYGIDDEEVVPPVLVSQSIPAVPDALRERVLRANRPMILNLTIDASGRVRSAVVVASLNAIYDRIVVDAAKAWRYQPARRAGQAVSYEKTVAVRVH